jgi:two-component system sensor histidine kinase EvgS
VLGVLTGVLVPCAIAADIELTEDERAWIQQHPVVRYSANSKLFPLEDTDGGAYRGLLAAYLQLVQARTGLRFELVETPTFDDAAQRLKTGDIQLFTNLSPRRASPDLREGLIFSKTYFSSPIVVITRPNAPMVLSTTDLAGKTVAVKTSAGATGLAMTILPTARILPVDTPLEALEAVAGGKADAAVGTEATYPAFVRRRFFNRLGVAGQLNVPPYEAQMAARKGNEPLISIIDKALGTITAHDTDVLYERWLRGADYGLPSAWAIVHYRWPEITGLSLLGIALVLVTAWALRERRRARRSEIAKTRFLAMMSHEIRTPINAMIASIEMMQRTTRDPRQTRLLGTAGLAADALSELLDNVLDLSKADAKRLELEKLPTDLVGLVGSAVQLAQATASSKDLEISAETSGTDHLVMIDATRFRQILGNLLSNAVKFTERGHIDVKLRVTPASDGSSSGQLNLDVVDTGIGIAAEHIPRLFDPYRQADESTTRRFGGTGLGLALCRELATLMGGSITLESVVGVGTRIHVSVPVALTSTPSRSLDEPASGVIGHRSPGSGQIAPVLVVEDHPANRDLLLQQLALMGVPAEAVADGETAILATREGVFSLVLMDCHMPAMDGYEAARRIRGQQTRETHLPIVAISAATDADHLQKCMQSGMDGVLRKPIRIPDLEGIMELWSIPYASEPVAPEVSVGKVDVDLGEALEDDMALLERAALNGEVRLVRHHAHRIRGAALMFDQHSLAEVARSLEDLASAGEMPPDEDIERLAQALSATCRSLRQRQ